MDIVIVLVNVIWNFVLFIPKIMLSLIPLYNALSSFKQDLIAAALGISPIVLWLLIKVLKIIVMIVKTN